METDTVAGDEIKLLSKIRQRCLRMDSRNDTAHAEELGGAAKEGFVARIEPESFVTEKPTEVEKVTGAAAQIENLKRSRAIEPKVLHALHVDADPVRCVFVSVDLPRIRSVRIALAQPL